VRTIYGILIRVAGGREPAPNTDCQIKRLSANSGTLSGRLKSHWLDSAAPGALLGFFSSSGIRAWRHEDAGRPPGLYFAMYVTYGMVVSAVLYYRLQRKDATTVAIKTAQQD